MGDGMYFMAGFGHMSYENPGRGDCFAAYYIETAANKPSRGHTETSFHIPQFLSTTLLHKTLFDQDFCIYWVFQNSGR